LRRAGGPEARTREKERATISQTEDRRKEEPEAARPEALRWYVQPEWIAEGGSSGAKAPESGQQDVERREWCANSRLAWDDAGGKSSWCSTMVKPVWGSLFEENKQIGTWGGSFQTLSSRSSGRRKEKERTNQALRCLSGAKLSPRSTDTGDDLGITWGG